MGNQPLEYSPYATANSLDTSYQHTISPAVKVLAALYLAKSLDNQNEQNSPTESEADAALRVILDWVDKLYDLAKFIFFLPHFHVVADDNIQTFETTLQRIRQDVAELRQPPAAKVAETSSDVAVVASRLLMRMQYSMDWVKQHMQSPPPSAATKKIWVSRLDASTCNVACRKMHGTSVGIDASFTAAALDYGIPKSMLYGSLWGPPIHPNCRCHLIYI